ncbi:MAG: amidohydrolase family protein, partial [Fimbriimonadaceae bacterium]|nr:amidohydrolase family protein [Fimbriimonadaceae bacterium]
VQYDQTKFPGAEHLTAAELDALSADRPILLRHSNGHASAANSAALRAAGIAPDEADPEGGEFVRDASGRLTGVLLERAHEIVTSRAPEPSLEEMVAAIMEAGRLLSSLGITCAADMMTGRWDLDRELTAYRLASERGCPIRLRLALQWNEVLGPKGMDPDRLREHVSAMNSDLCRVIGLKIFADGAIGSATAAIHGRYKTTGGQGSLIYSPDRLKEMVLAGHERGWSIIIHSIGDRATDLVMDALEATDDPARHRIEHVMILSDDQIERLRRLGCTVTLQPEFLARFGHAYRAQLPDDVWPKLKRVRSLLDAGVPLALNTDRPIVPGLPELGLETAVRRPSGFDSREEIRPEEAELGWTEWAAAANGDHGQGRLAPGCWADLRLYDSPGGALREVWRNGEPVWRDGRPLV